MDLKDLAFLLTSSNKATALGSFPWQNASTDETMIRLVNIVLIFIILE
jgi:hypothetical protein